MTYWCSDLLDKEVNMFLLKQSHNHTRLCIQFKMHMNENNRCGQMEHKADSFH